MSKKFIHATIKLVISASILFYLITLIDFHKLLQAITEADYKYLLICLAGSILLVSIKAFRWFLLLHNDNIKYPLKNAVRAYFASFLLGVITPGRLGEFMKLYYLRRDIDVDLNSGLKSVILDRIFDLFLLILFGMAGILVIFFNYEVLIAFPFSTVVIIILIVIMKFSMRFFKSTNNIMLFVNKLISGLSGFRNLVNWFLTLIAYLLFFYLNKLVFVSLDISLSFTNITFVISIVSLVILLPVSIAGFGTREASLIYLLSFFEIPIEKALLFSFLQFLLFFLWGGIIGLAFWITSPIPVKIIRKDADKVLGFVKKIINIKKS